MNNNDSTIALEPNVVKQLNNVTLADMTGLYVDLANKMAQYTRVSTNELTKIITSINQANQVL